MSGKFLRKIISLSFLIGFLVNIAPATEQPSLTFLFKNHTGNVSDKWENYLSVYEAELQKYRIKENISILEIGVQNGGSLQIWRKYFNNNAKIVGLDIDPNVCKLNLGEGIKTLCFDGSNPNELDKHIEANFFDIIIDDGSHVCSDVISTFENLFLKLKPGGIYIVEDAHTSYWETHGGSLKGDKTIIEYFKNIVDLINKFHIREESYLGKMKKFLGISHTFSSLETYYSEWIDSIKFVDSMVIITKRSSQKNSPFKRLLTGKLAPVSAITKTAETESWFKNTKDLAD